MAQQTFDRRANPDFSIERKPRLLIVDEKEEDLREYSGMLRGLDYDVRPVGSYADAAALLEKELFDLVIVDQGSEDFEGRAVLCRAVESGHQTPVLVLTGVIDPGCCISALDMGAREYVQKNLTRSELQELVAEYLEPSMEFPSAQQEPLFHSEGANLERWRKAS
ncbi:MAG TPA: response regulator [Terriglobia bacterium]|nr:response regulator [Terriglobia bacterium]